MNFTESASSVRWEWLLLFMIVACTILLFNLISANKTFQMEYHSFLNSFRKVIKACKSLTENLFAVKIVNNDCKTAFWGHHLNKQD